MTDMNSMFNHARSFDGYISNWDVSRVTDMYAMFANARLFDGYISNWDVSRVTSMADMFRHTSFFNSDISGWNISYTTRVTAMLDNADGFDQNLGPWYIVLDGNTIQSSDVPGTVGSISTRNLYLDSQSPKYGIGLGGDSDYFEITGNVLSMVSVPDGDSGPYTVDITSTGDYGTDNSRTYEITVISSDTNPLGSTVDPEHGTTQQNSAGFSESELQALGERGGGSIEHADLSPYLHVSAESRAFENHFAGSMVVEVRVSDPSMGDTGEPTGMPSVTVDGNRLQMTQSSGGDWYAYFANAQSAMTADQIAFDSGTEGKGLDFGVLCGSDTAAGVFGVSFSDTEGFFVPRHAGLEGFANGHSPPSKCAGDLTGSENVNNVVRKPPRINENPGVPPGQTGLSPNAWPVVQLFSLSNDVAIRYEPAGNTQKVVLQYDEIPGITSMVDRDLHPIGSEVLVFVSDMQLNQDPTDRDSWTFQADASPMVFYQAFDYEGTDDANGTDGLTDIFPFLARLGFEDNGFMEVDLGEMFELKPNGIQPSEFVSDGTDTFHGIITIVEDDPSSGMFVNYDSDKASNLGVSDSAPRNRAGYIHYNDEATSVFVGSTAASLSVTSPVAMTTKDMKPGTKVRVVLFDPDQDINTLSSSRDDLLVPRDSARIPTIMTGSPLTLNNAGEIHLYESDNDPVSEGNKIPSSVPDPFSARLYLNTPEAANQVFEKMSLNLGFPADSLSDLLTVAEKGPGSGWLNLDLRSLEQLGIDDLSSTGISLYFGSLLDPNPVAVVNPGDLSSPQQILLLDPSVAVQVSSKKGPSFAVIDFGPSTAGRISNESSSQPIVMDFFSFGVVRNDVVSNAVYRMELEEDSDNPGRFVGSVGHVVAKRDGLGAEIADTVVPTNSEVVVVYGAKDSQIVINYSDLASAAVATISSELGTTTHSGDVSYSSSLRFGSPVTVQLNDPDLNASGDKIDVYRVIDDPASPGVDTVGTNGRVLLEVKINDIRYQRCVVNGVEYGGLESTGFVLSETGPSTGIFEGSFNMPSQICDRTGSKLVSPDRGNINVIYHDAADASGNKNIFSLKRHGSLPIPPTLSSDRVHLDNANPVSEVVLSGKIGSLGGGDLLYMTITNPDRTIVDVKIPTNADGSYFHVISVKANSLPGKYVMDISHKGTDLGILTLSVTSGIIPDWVRDKSLEWSSGTTSVAGFASGIRHLIVTGIVDGLDTQVLQPVVPDWFRHTAALWVDGQISDEEFVGSVQYMIENGIIRI